MDATPQFHQRVRDLFEQAVERPEAERSIFLEIACAGDPALLQAVSELIRARDSQTSFLQSSAGGKAVQRIGRYVIRGELGRGAMGVVYDAVDPLIGRNVALKVIRIEQLTEQKEAEFLTDRLFREARSAGQLFHPCIVVVLDVGQEGDTAFIAMERIEGHTLQQIIAAGHRPTFDQILGILHQTAAALDYAHQHGVVHRDIKPANIMVQAGMLVKVADFGIAKIMSAQNATQSGVVMGTPTYMSPEQIEGLPVDGRSDQFSLAVLAYELLTGVRPFQGDSLASLAHSIVYAERPLATVANPALPAAVNPVLQRAFARPPEQRYASCGDLVRAIESALDTPATAAPPPMPAMSIPQAPPTFVPAPFAPGTVAPAPATVAPAPTPTLGPQTLGPQTFAGPPAKSGAGKTWLIAIGVLLLVAVAIGATFVLSRRESPAPAPAASSTPAPTPASTTRIAVQRFAAEPANIEPGAMSRLNWSVTGAQQIAIDHGIGNVAPSGELAVTPTESTIYVLTATGAGPEVHATAAVNVKAADVKPKQPSPAARARQFYDEAAEKRRAGQLPQALALLRQSADLGEPLAMLELAENYRDGEGAAKNSAEAVTWFQKAAQTGDSAAMVELGAMYLLGDGIKTDFPAAAKWFQQAADRGNPAGMYDLASLYETGRGIPLDLERAKALYRKSADLGNTEASRRLQQLTRRK